MSDELKKQLIEIPERIRVQEFELLDLVENLTILNRENDLIESHYKTEIAMNQSFKNEGQRKASLEIQLKENTRYQELQDDIPKLSLQIKKAQIEIGYQRNLLQSYLAIAGMQE